MCVRTEQNPQAISLPRRTETRGRWLEYIGGVSRWMRGKESLLFHRESRKTVSLYAIMARICRTLMSRVTVASCLRFWISGTRTLCYTHESKAKRHAINLRLLYNVFSQIRFESFNHIIQSTVNQLNSIIRQSNLLDILHAIIIERYNSFYNRSTN